MKKFLLDIHKYKQYSGDKSSVLLCLTTQGLWALFVYRIGNAIYVSKLPKLLKRIFLVITVFYQKIIEVTTGISLPYAASIGTHFYIAHFGQIIIHPNAIIGDNCNISQGVTIGVSGRGEKRGIPIIGNNVFIAANAIVVGAITVGDNVVIGANSLVLRDVDSDTTVLGVPAVVINNNNSEGYI